MKETEPNQTNKTKRSQQNQSSDLINYDRDTFSNADFMMGNSMSNLKCIGPTLAYGQSIFHLFHLLFTNKNPKFHRISKENLHA